MRCYLLLLVVLSAEIYAKAAVLSSHHARHRSQRSSFDPNAYSQSMADAHNQYRSPHCAPLLTPDSTLAAGAQAYAETLAQLNKMQHSDTDNGENLYAASSTASVACGDATGPTSAWYNEIKQYNFGSPGFSSATGHFTQVVWVGSTKIGCGCAPTSNNKVLYVVCWYADSGNWDGEFGSNVLASGSC